MAHFLEDSHRSNELLVVYTWVPFAWFAWPTLVVGTAQDIADTGPQILGFLLYLPLLDDARKLTMMWMAYCFLASARSLQLCMSHAGMKAQLTPFLLRILLLELAGLVAGRARIWYLSRQGTPLTSSYLDQCSRTKEVQVQPVNSSDLQQEHQAIPHAYVPSGACGRAEMIARSIWHRRRLYKDELRGRLLWAVHLHAEKQLTSDLLLHILTFLQEPERPVTTFLGLLSDDNTSQISGSQRTRMHKQLGMLCLLERIDRNCLMVFHRLVKDSMLTDRGLDIMMMVCSLEMEAVEEEFVMTSTTSSPDRRGGRVRTQEEATWGFSRTGQAFYRRVIAPVLEQAGVVKAQAPPPRALPSPIAKSSSASQGAHGGPLMPPNVQQAMRAWTARPSLLTPRPPMQQRSHDAVSSSSSGHQEIVAEEVRRQVQGALQARDASMRTLMAENEELKRMLVVQTQALGAVRETGRPMSRPTPLPSSQVVFLETVKADLYLEEAKLEQRVIRDILVFQKVNRDRVEVEEETHGGMRQLQQAYLEKKDGPEQEVIKGGIELPKLPEPHADGGVEFQDWVYMTEQMVGSLTDKAGAWYMATLACAKEAFARYQTATPLDRLNIAPALPDQLRAKLWERLDRRVLTLVLAAMPRQAKEDAVTHRVKTTADALFRLYVLYQPGSTTERAAVLKLLEGAPAGENPEEAVTALRRWRRHLNRAVDMGITPPDASLQLRGLDLIIAKVVERDAGLSFRLSLARHTLQLQNRPTQETVLQFYDHALAEIQQLAPLKGKSQSGPEATKLRALGTSAGTGESTSPTSPSSAKGSGKGAEKTPCKFFTSDAGCKKGGSCKFAHSFASREEKKSRCWTCGARNHRQADCPVKPKTKDPATPKAAAALAVPQSATSSMTSAATQLQTALPSASSTMPQQSTQSSTLDSTAAATSSTTTSSQPSGMSQHEREVKALLQEANAMLSKLTQLQALTVTQESSDELRVAIKAYEAQVRARTALLDSGASHAFRPLREGELDNTTPIKVELAGGQETWLRQTKAGTLVPSSHDDGATAGSIVPLGALVQQLNCTLTWSKDDGLVINHPSYGKIAAQTIGNCPVISEAQALSLIAELEQAKVNELEGHVSDGQLRVLNWDLEELRSWEGAMATYVATGKRHHGLEALMMPSFPFGQVDESIRGLLVEDVDLSDQAGWNYLKAMPIRRAMRKRLFQTSWIVHLYAGPYDKKTDNLKVTERNGVTVLELDILRSSLFSLRGQSSAYKLLLWAALRGQIVSVVGGPPRDSESMELICKQLFLWTVADKAMRMMRLPAPGFMMELPEGHGFWKSEVWSRWSHGLRMPSCYVSAGINEGQYRVATNLDFYKALPVERAASRDVPTWSPSSWTTTFKDQICDALQAWYKEPDLPRLVRMLAKFEGNYDEMSLA
ncbi:unnamed protein product, partial [Symbiodinium necroappetens]